MTTDEDAHTASPVTGVDPESDEPHPRGRRRGLVWLTLGAVLVAAAGIATWLWVGNAFTESSPAATGPVATAVVERGTISATTSWSGTLGRGSPSTVVATGMGTVTRMIDQGAAVQRGTILHWIDEQPVTLLYGSIPMYRDLEPSDTGTDVEQLETNLAALGYDGFTVDDEYAESTAEAVRAWQADIGAQPTGTVSRAYAVFLPEGGRVDTLHASVGDTVTPGTPILDLTRTEQVVSLKVDIDDRDRFDVGTEVTVLLPGGDEVIGMVDRTAVVKVAAQDAVGGLRGSDADSESIAQVEIALEDEAPDDLIGAPVEVVVAIDERADVLLVPVNALLALSEGGYGLEVVRADGTTEIVTVDTGLFAGGKVQVEGDKIAEGTVVGVAGR